MSTTPTVTPARAARRQLLLDRFAEYLTDRGIHPDRAAGYARDLQQHVDDLGFRLPASIEDTEPPAPSPSTLEGRRAARALLDQALARRHAAPHT